MLPKDDGEPRGQAVEAEQREEPHGEGHDVGAQVEAREHHGERVARLKRGFSEEWLWRRQLDAGSRLHAVLDPRHDRVGFGEAAVIGQPARRLEQAAAHPEHDQ